MRCSGRLMRVLPSTSTITRRSARDHRPTAGGCRRRSGCWRGWSFPSRSGPLRHRHSGSRRCWLRTDGSTGSTAPWTAGSPDWLAPSPASTAPAAGCRLPCRLVRLRRGLPAPGWLARSDCWLRSGAATGSPARLTAAAPGSAGRCPGGSPDGFRRSPGGSPGGRHRRPGGGPRSPPAARTRSGTPRRRRATRTARSSSDSTRPR